MKDVPDELEERRAHDAANAAKASREFARKRIWWLGFWAKFGKAMAWFVALGPFAVIFLDTSHATFGSAIGGSILWAICAAIMGYDAGNDELRRLDEQPTKPIS